MLHPLFRGFCPALPTPLREHTVDLVAFERIARLQLDGGASALLVGGTTGEGSLLTDRERGDLISVARSLTSRPVIGAVSDVCPERAAITAAVLAEAGAGALLVLTPPYVRGTEEGLIAYLNALHRAVPLPQILYHVPARTGFSVSLSLLSRLCEECPFLIGIKEASEDVGRIVALGRDFSHRLGLWCGADLCNLTALVHGFHGLMSVACLPCPTLIAEMIDCLSRGDIGGATVRQLAALPLIRALFAQVNPVPVKALLSHMGLMENHLRTPLSPASAETERALIAAVRTEGLRGYVDLK